MPPIKAVAIPHQQQRYPTCGDWWFEPESFGGTLTVKVSMTGSDHYDTLVMVHEIVEALLCKARGIDEEHVTKFDVQYESERGHDDNSEPGDDPRAPYNKEHIFATKIEKLLAAELGVDWTKYEETIYNLF